MLGRQCFLLVFALAAFTHGLATICVAQEAPSSAGDDAAQPKPDVIEIPLTPIQPEPVPSTRKFPPVEIPNFASCPIAQLQRVVPELAHLKPAEDQTKLAELLEKIGVKTVEIARKTPNLISDEAVASEFGKIKTHQNFSYLVLQHPLGPQSMVLDEFRVDVKTGKKFETEDFEKVTANSSSSAPSGLELPVLIPSAPQSQDAPSSQGFVNDWLHFYPSNRKESDFRYLGQQKMDGHLTYVVAFAQKPGLVRLPARIGLENKTVPIFMQGSRGWIDRTSALYACERTCLRLHPKCRYVS